MNIIQPQQIPQWLCDEAEEYFVPLPFVPNTILDIGANIGAFAKKAHDRWPKAQLICCEPMPFNVSQLRRNAPPGTSILSAAIRAHNGVDAIFVGDSFVTGGFIQLGRQTQQQILVECIAAADLPLCELVKIDTEGSEVEILENLRLEHTRGIFLEHHSRADAERIKAMLAPMFDLVGNDSGGALGTFAFLRR
jgi:FkbM family methyltransferase